MIILGIHDGHNATASIVKNGKILSSVSEERFTRLKNDAGYPQKAVDYVLTVNGIKPSEIDMVALSTKEQDPIGLRAKRDTLFKISDFVREMHEYWKPLLYENRETDFWEKIYNEPRFVNNNSPYNVDFIKTASKDQWVKLFNVERCRVIKEHLKISDEQIVFVDHHTGHACYAYYASPHSNNQKSAVVTADSWGDGCNATISVAENGKVTEIFRTSMCNIARLYRWMTLLLGMKPNEHEYKVMGLAPYAQDYVRDPAYEIFKETLVVDGLDFKWKVKPSDMYFYFKEKFEGMRFDGIAAGVQLWMEDLLSEWITNIMQYTQTEVLYYSGGLSMNVKANKTIAGLPAIRGLYVPPSGGDESLAIGAALVIAIEKGDIIESLENAYLGYSPSMEESEVASRPFRENSLYMVIDDPDDDYIAGLLAEGKVLARCKGRMEFGARALGNRSILCNPSKYENLRIINEKIKFRDFWMPFTPSILKERADDYLINPKKLNAYYMTLAFDSTDLARKHITAAMHPYDFTIRPQLVSEETNSGYYNLIKAFERKTGIGALLNTSLNLHGSPIVCNAADAVDTLVKSGLDGLLLPGILILKRETAL